MRKIVYVEPADYFPDTERKLFEKSPQKACEIFVEDEGYEQELSEVAERYRKAKKENNN